MKRLTGIHQTSDGSTVANTAYSWHVSLLITIVHGGI